MLGLGLQELIVILVILLLLFGAKKLPELSRSLGESAREIRKGFDGDTETSKKSDGKKTAAKSSKKSS